MRNGVLEPFHLLVGVWRILNLFRTAVVRPPERGANCPDQAPEVRRVKARVGPPPSRRPSRPRGKLVSSAALQSAHCRFPLASVGIRPSSELARPPRALQGQSSRCSWFRADRRPAPLQNQFKPSCNRPLDLGGDDQITTKMIRSGSRAWQSGLRSEAGRTPCNIPPIHPGDEAFCVGNASKNAR